MFRLGSHARAAAQLTSPGLHSLPAWACCAWRLSICVLGLASLPLPALAQTPSFQGLGQMPGSMQGSGTYTNEVSGDGSTVVGHAGFSTSGNHPYRWTAASGFEDLGSLGGNDGAAYSASFDGSVVVGQSRNDQNTPRAFRWRQGAGMEELPFYEARGVSANGSVAVGINLRWTAPGQLDSLGFLGGNNSTFAYGVSADGQVAVGTSESSPNRHLHAFRWTPAGGIQDLGVTTGTESIAWGISPNGAVIFGEARDGGGYWRAFQWTSALGMRDMGTLGGPMSTSHDASADGRVIVGKSLATSSSGSLRAFRWTAETGMRDLRQELLDAGVTAVQDWILAVAAGVSDDGTVIVGWGYPAALTPAQPFRAVLPVPGTTGTSGDLVAAPAALYDAFPNPFRTTSVLHFALPERARVRLTIYDVLGRVVTTLMDKDFPGGIHHVTWDGRSSSGRILPSAVYVATMDAGRSDRRAIRLVLAR